MRSEPSPQRRTLGVLLAVLLVVGVGALLVLSIGQQLGAGAAIQVRGLIGSEKEAFFADPRLREALRDTGLEVTVEKAGSRQIATSFDLDQYDFAFPAGVPAAEKIRRDRGIAAAYKPFVSPMAIATWQPIVEILVRNGIARREADRVVLDVAAYLDLVERDVRWKDLAGSEAYPVSRRVLITSTDVRRSNSGAMYLSLASYVANGERVVENDADVARVLPAMLPLFLRQGFVEYSSEAPFEDYLVQGIGKAPMVLIYEQQYVERAARGDGTIRPEMVLMYPEPGIVSEHTLVGLTEGGRRLGAFLTTDPVAREVAIEYGYRTGDAAAFNAFAKDRGLALPETFLDVVDPPSYELLERMILEIERAYGTDASPGATP